MYPVVKPCEEPRMLRGAGRPAGPAPCITTLFDLIATLQALVGLDDALTVATVVYGLRSGWVTWCDAPRELRCEAKT